MDLFSAMILGVVQGVTEFLPISSDGHLLFVEHLLKLPAEQLFSFDILLHLATLLAIVIYFFQPIGRLCQAGASFVIPSCNTPAIQKEKSLIPALIISTIITGAVGILFKDPIEGLRDHMDLLGLFFIMTGLLLLATKGARRDNAETETLPNNIWLFAILMGLGQALAILPGVSRSGTTISLALLVGASRGFAVEYSFLMSIPAVAGAVILAITDMEWNFTAGPAAVGFVSSLLAGLVALWLLVLITSKGHIHRFAYYVIPLGFVVRWLTLS